MMQRGEQARDADVTHGIDHAATRREALGVVGRGLAALAVGAGVGFAPLSEAMAGPSPRSLMRELRAFLKVMRRVEARVLINQTGAALGEAPITDTPEGAPADALAMPGAEDAEPKAAEANAPKPDAEEPDAPKTPQVGATTQLSISRDKQIKVEGLGEAVREVELRKFGKKAREGIGPHLTLLAVALGVGRFDRTLKRLGTVFRREVLTLDRIDGRLVWALGDRHAAVWIDRETFRPVRYYFGPDVIDPSAWTVKLGYADEGTGRGWFPDRVTLLRGAVTEFAMRVVEVEINPR